MLRQTKQQEDQQMVTTRRINFKASASYSQEQNGVSERVGRTLVEMTQATVLEGNIEDQSWPEVLLAMTYIRSDPTKR